MFPCHVKIHRSGAGALMPQETLDVIKVRSGFQQMGRKAMPQSVHQRLFPDPRFSRDALNTLCIAETVTGSEGLSQGKATLKVGMLSSK